ncbi:MAG: DUF3298 domain-containing protein [Bacteroidota bacterium]
MKKISVLPFIFFVLLYSCIDDTTPIAFKTKRISKPFDASIDISYDTVDGNNEIAQTINTVIENRIIESIGFEETYTTIEDAAEAFNKEYVDFKNDFPDTEQLWELAIETEITYKSKTLISMAISTYSDKGGAHGNDAISLININASTGEAYKNEDIVELNNDFKALAKSYFLKEIEDDSIEDYFFGEPFHLPANIGISDDGLIVLYNVYEIASYAQGYKEFTIPFSDVQPYLKVD